MNEELTSHNVTNIIEVPNEANLFEPAIIIGEFKRGIEERVLELPSWFCESNVSEVEKNYFGELICCERDIGAYKDARNALLDLGRKNYVSVSEAIDKINLSIFLIMKTHIFFERHGMLNTCSYPIGIVKTTGTDVKLNRPALDSLGDFICVECGTIYTQNNLYFLHYEKIGRYLYCCRCSFESQTEPVVSARLNHKAMKFVWSKHEEYKLLAAIETHGDNWGNISAECNRPKIECLLKFLTLKPAELDLKGSIDQLFSTSGNPILSLIVFICGSIHHRVGSDASKFAIQHYGASIGSILDSAAASASRQKVFEEKKLEKLNLNLIESLTKRLKLKMARLSTVIHEISSQKENLTSLKTKYEDEYLSLRSIFKGINSIHTYSDCP